MADHLTGLPHPYSLLIGSIATDINAKWPPGSMMMPSDKITLEFTHRDLNIILKSLQVAASIQALTDLK